MGEDIQEAIDATTIALREDQKRLNNILSAWKRGGWSVQLQHEIEAALEGTDKSREEIRHLQ